MTQPLSPFHLAFPVHDLDAARAFYGGVLGCPEGRSSDEWVDFDFHGHQIVAHLAPALCPDAVSLEPDPSRSGDQTKSSPEPDPSRSGEQTKSSPEPDPSRSGDQTNMVDGKGVPVRHFGLVLGMADWQTLADRLKGQVDFLIDPHIRFKGETGEQATMFFTDPSGNAIEIKAFADMSRLFAR